MLAQPVDLSSRALDAIADLERRVVAADGGRLKLEWEYLRGRRDGGVQGLLWWEGDRLLGFLGLYEFGSPPELAGMVAPDARGRGIGAELLDCAIDLCRRRRHAQALLIVPRASGAGRQLATRRDGVLDHSEHALVLSGAPLAGAAARDAVGDAMLSLRPAATADVGAVSRLLEVGFGGPALDVPSRLDSPGEQTLVVELGGSPVGTLRLARDGDEADVYGFVIDPSWQGRGIGREVLRRACAELRANGARRIRLEVAIDNDRALALYTSVGFAPVTTEDYYALPVSVGQNPTA